MPIGRQPYVTMPRRKKPGLVRCYRVPATCIREARSGKAIEVEARGERTWIPIKAILPSSKVNKLGDAGELVIMEWAAKMKGWM